MFILRLDTNITLSHVMPISCCCPLWMPNSFSRLPCWSSGPFVIRPNGTCVGEDVPPMFELMSHGPSIIRPNVPALQRVHEVYKEDNTGLRIGLGLGSGTTLLLGRLWNKMMFLARPNGTSAAKRTHIWEVLGLNLRRYTFGLTKPWGANGHLMRIILVYGHDAGVRAPGSVSILLVCGLWGFICFYCSIFCIY